MIGEAVRTQQKIKYVVVCPELLDSDFGNKLITTIEAKGIDLITVSESTFLSISLKEGPQGIAAIVEENWGELKRNNAHKRSLGCA